MINNYKCLDCNKYIVCSWRKILDDVFGEESEMGKNVTITMDYCRENNEVK